LWLEGDKVSLHNIWLQCTYDFHEVRIELQRMEDANIIHRDDGNYIQTSEISPKGGH